MAPLWGLDQPHLNPALWLCAPRSRDGRLPDLWVWNVADVHWVLLLNCTGFGTVTNKFCHASCLRSWGEGGGATDGDVAVGLALYLLRIHIQRHFPVTMKHLYR